MPEELVEVKKKEDTWCINIKNVGNSTPAEELSLEAYSLWQAMTRVSISETLIIPKSRFMSIVESEDLSSHLLNAQQINKALKRNALGRLSEILRSYPLPPVLLDELRHFFFAKKERGIHVLVWSANNAVFKCSSLIEIETAIHKLWASAISFDLNNETPVRPLALVLQKEIKLQNHLCIVVTTLNPVNLNQNEWLIEMSYLDGNVDKYVITPTKGQSDLPYVFLRQELAPSTQLKRLTSQEWLRLLPVVENLKSLLSQDDKPCRLKFRLQRKKFKLVLERVEHLEITKLKTDIINKPSDRGCYLEKAHSRTWQEAITSAKKTNMCWKRELASTALTPLEACLLIEARDPSLQAGLYEYGILNQHVKRPLFRLTSDDSGARLGYRLLLEFKNKGKTQQRLTVLRDQGLWMTQAECWRTQYSQKVRARTIELGIQTDNLVELSNTELFSHLELLWNESLVDERRRSQNEMCWLVPIGFALMRAEAGSIQLDSGAIVTLAQLVEDHQELLSTWNAHIRRLHKSRFELRKLLFGKHTISLEEAEQFPGEPGAALRAFIEREKFNLIGDTLSSPTLRERPDVLLAMIRAIIFAPAVEARSLTPAAFLERCTEQHRKHLDNIIRTARACFRVRAENQMSRSIFLGLLRLGLLEVGRRSQVPREDVVFCDTTEEARQLLVEKDNGSIRTALSERRKAAYNLSMTEDAPEYIPSSIKHVNRTSTSQQLLCPQHAYFKFNACLDNPPRSESRRISSVPTSRMLHGCVGNPGNARGRIRIVLRAEHICALQKDDIAVLRCESLAPICCRLAAAIITDDGSAFGWAAVQARASHIPAVIAVPNASRILTTGELVYIGSNGTSAFVTRLNVMPPDYEYQQLKREDQYFARVGNCLLLNSGSKSNEILVHSGNRTVESQGYVVTVPSDERAFVHIPMVLGGSNALVPSSDEAG